MMHEFLDYYRRNAVRFFDENRAAKILTLCGFAVIFLFLAIGIYQLFAHGFSYIARDDYFKEALTLYIVEVFLFISFLLILASAFISGVFALYRSANDDVLMSSPFFSAKLSLAGPWMFISSLWPLAIIIFPALCALQRVFHFSLWGFLLAFSSTVVLIAFSILIVVDFLLIIGIVLEAMRKFSLHTVVATSCSVFLGTAYIIWAHFHSVDLVKFFQAQLLAAHSSDITPVIEQFYFFPSHFSALTIHFVLANDTFEAMRAFMYLIALTAVFWALFFLVKKHYLRLWQRSEEHARMLPQRKFFRLLTSRLSLERSASARGAVFCKELVSFVRNTRGMMWFGFILFIWLIQIGSSHVLVHGLSSERIATERVPGIIGMLQFSSIMYFVSLFVLRFAFPSFSAERKTSWVLAMSPIDFREVFFMKLMFFTCSFSLIALVFVLVNALTVGLALPFRFSVLCIVLLGTFFLTVAGLSLGAIFPNKETDDPERLSTTMPGIGFILGALVYGGAGAFALSRHLVQQDTLPYFAFITLTIAGILFLIHYTRRSLSREVFM